MSAVISSTDLTQDDLDLLSDILNDYLENFDAEEVYFNGVDDPQARHESAQNLYSRFIGVDLTGELDTLHHVDCACEWCELARNSNGNL